jgi:guanylate kinase
MNPLLPHPVLLVVSAPSGAGKTTLCDRLLAWAGGALRYSVSCTTRAPRAGEQDGVHYRFLDEAAFQAREAEGAFLESALVHGHAYGTPRAVVERDLQAGIGVLMDIDVQGAAQVRAALARRSADDPLRGAYADVFIAPPSIEALQRRLIARGKDAPEVVARRVARAKGEMDRAGEYRYRLVNDDLDTAFEALRSILVAESHRTRGRG